MEESASCSKPNISKVTTESSSTDRNTFVLRNENLKMSFCGRYKHIEYSDSNIERGLSAQFYIMFLKIPYAKGPTGERRLRSPETYEYDPKSEGEPYETFKEPPLSLQLMPREVIMSPKKGEIISPEEDVDTEEEVYVVKPETGDIEIIAEKKREDSEEDEATSADIEDITDEDMLTSRDVEDIEKDEETDDEMEQIEMDEQFEEQKTEREEKSEGEVESEKGRQSTEENKLGDKNEPGVEDESGAELGVVGEESCLYLSVYIPKEPSKEGPLLPVFVYFHGGGFTGGSGRYDYITPDFLIVYDIIFVSVNYRLGPLGFLNLHDKRCKGNAGLKDQVMALKWVQEHISYFGGDKENVTICGQSAGGSCVNFHLISPMSRDLFAKAIIQSGGMFCPWGFRSFQTDVKMFYDRQLDGNALEKLMKMDAAEIVQFSRTLSKKRNTFSMSADMGVSVESFSESENAFIPCDKDLSQLMREAKQIPILAGITEEEGYELCMEGFSSELWKVCLQNDDIFCDFLQANLFTTEEVTRSHLEELRNRYFPDVDFLSPEEIQKGYAELCGDLSFYLYYENFKLGENESVPVFLYKFNYVTDLNPSLRYRLWKKGASHSDELPYLYGPGEIKNEYTPFPKDMERKTRTMCELWASFCKTGKPHSRCHDDIQWLPHTEENPCYLHIDDEDFEMKYERLKPRRWSYLQEIVQKDNQYANQSHISRMTNAHLNYEINLQEDTSSEESELQDTSISLELPISGGSSGDSSSLSPEGCTEDTSSAHSPFPKKRRENE